MARDQTRVNSAIWNDEDWLDLPPAAQHLYFVLWTHPDLSYAGVTDWRPARLAQRAGQWTEDEVRRAGACLEARLFIVIDEQTEEVLVRPFVRFDGLMKQPIMAVSFANARAAVASRTIKAVIVHEAMKHHAQEPELAGWAKPQVQELLAGRSLDPRARALPEDPLTPASTQALTPGLTLSPGVGEASANPSAYPSPTSSSTSLLLTTSEIADAKPDAARDDVDRICQHLADRIDGNGSKRPVITKRWRDAARLLLDKDKRTEEQVHAAIDWCQESEFWKANILSMPKLREQYDRIRLNAQRATGAQPAAAPRVTAPPVHQY